MNGIDVAAALAAFQAELAEADSPDAIERIRRAHTGKKSALKLALRNLRSVPPEDRRTVAQSINAAQKQVEMELAEAGARIHAAAMEARLNAEWTDLTLPGVSTPRGSRHPLTDVERKCMAVMRQLGFVPVEGPEVETPYFNFDALNIPEHHPARDMQDTFWVDNNLVLRTHTTSVQARELSKRPELPFKIVSMGRVYRNEAVDATHLAMFHQFEGIWVEKGLTFAHLKATLAFIVEALYGPGKLRFKPKFYPYTEPSVGVDLACASCDGAGCSACSGGWVTILGAGMIHPKLLIQFGYDPDEVSGIAFGLGTTRMAAQSVKMDALRPLYVPNLTLLHSLCQGQS
ncbi:MAG: phenylalanyl-tRNA synthetase alpha chain [Myxococcota bacterium]|jgi:phenylalanyl-tRNA synthetase alpha chain